MFSVYPYIYFTSKLLLFFFILVLIHKGWTDYMSGLLFISACYQHDLQLGEQCGSEVQQQSRESLMSKEYVDHITQGKQSC